MSGVNDFTIKIANVNGSGSASANGLLAKAIFRMGVPVSAKNIFPSNIQGLPTWYVIRVNQAGYTGWAGRTDFLIAMNPQSMNRDIAELESGSFVLYDSARPLSAELPEGVRPLAVPLTDITVDVFPDVKTRLMMKNISYVGAAAAFLNIDSSVIETLLREIYSRKPKLIDSNYHAVRLAYEWVRENYPGGLPLRVEPAAANEGCIMIDGNTASALGCLYAGATFAAWYPLTPSTSVAETFTRLCERFRRDPESGDNLYCIVQAEDEIAAIGMVVGAGWNGARAFTPTSGPGISLMSEFLGLAYYAEIPAVVFDVQRTGPSTGLPTRTQQGDFLTAAYASHGDTKHILLFPGHPGECFSMAVESFDLAERFQTPVIVLTDLDIGMNDWMVKKFEWDDNYVPDRGKVVKREHLRKLEDTGGTFHRYIDADGDGICARSLPGSHPAGAYFTRGTGHNPQGTYSEDGGDYKENVARLLRKFEGAKSAVPPPEIISAGSSLGIIAAGGADAAVKEALDLLNSSGLSLDYMRIRAFPFGCEVEEFLKSHDWIAVVDQNRDAQLRSLLLLETRVTKDKLRSVHSNDGYPVSAAHVAAQITELLPMRITA